MHFHHIALLVNSLEKTSERLDSFRSLMEPIENFPSEGTRERYIGPEDTPARLLLMQPTDKSGPYARALQKRGPGLHHLALNVPNLGSFIETLECTGWFLLPQSLRAIKQCKTAWLGRPGIRTLLEIHEQAPVIGTPFVTGIELPIGGRSKLISYLCPGGIPVAGFKASPDNEIWISIDSQRIATSALVE